MVTVVFIKLSLRFYKDEKGRKTKNKTFWLHAHC